jgi:hypothetical protein
MTQSISLTCGNGRFGQSLRSWHELEVRQACYLEPSTTLSNTTSFHWNLDRAQDAVVLTSDQTPLTGTSAIGDPARIVIHGLAAPFAISHVLIVP